MGRLACEALSRIHHPWHRNPLTLLTFLCSQVLAHAVRAARLPSRVVLRVQDSLTQLEDALGGCERLLETPVPMFYTR